MNVSTESLSDNDQSRLTQAIESIVKAGGRAYLVGGAVRDALLKHATKDFDVEVHGLELEKLIEILSAFGILNLVGKSFGVLKWEHSTIDWSLPRSDFKGRKPDVVIDPFMEITSALQRRDLTINAMAIDLATREFIDPFGGKKDLEKKVARSPDSAFFCEDPLRFYRVMQFIGRFDLTPDQVLDAVCSTMDISGVSRERIASEFDKLFLLSKFPSLGIRWIERIGRLKEILPELAKTVGVLQQQEWHPEGDVFEHSMQAMDAAAAEKYDNESEKLMIIQAAMCHDLGKALKTRIEGGRIRSTGHDLAGVEPARNLLKRICLVKKRRDTICKLVEHHMAPLGFIKGNAGRSAYKRLAVKLAPDASIRILCLLTYADRRGRNPVRGVPLIGRVEDLELFEARAREIGVFDGPEAPILTGDDLKGFVKSGPEMGKLLALAYSIQIQKGVRAKDVLLRHVLEKGGIVDKIALS